MYYCTKQSLDLKYWSALKMAEVVVWKKFPSNNHKIRPAFICKHASNQTECASLNYSLPNFFLSLQSINYLWPSSNLCKCISISKWHWKVNTVPLEGIKKKINAKRCSMPRKMSVSHTEYTVHASSKPAMWGEKKHPSRPWLRIYLGCLFFAPGMEMAGRQKHLQGTGSMDQMFHLDLKR